MCCATINVLRRKSPKRLAFSNFDGLVLPLSDFATHCECLGDRKAGDGHPLAWRWFSLFLAMEVAISRRQATGAARNSPIDPGNESRQSAVGCSPKCHGHSRPANRAPLAMAEWTYGTADWLDPAGMS